jgi:hypothetical protein
MSRIVIVMLPMFVRNPLPASYAVGSSKQLQYSTDFSDTIQKTATFIISHVTNMINVLYTH